MSLDDNIKKLDNINCQIDKLFSSFKNGIPVQNIFNRNQYMEVYTDCYNICIIKSNNFTYSELVYSIIKQN